MLGRNDGLTAQTNTTGSRHMKTQCLLRRNQYHTTAWMDARTIKLDAGLVVHRAHPLNAETSVPALMGGVVMPNGRFYIRNHFQIPNSMLPTIGLQWVVW